MVTLHTYPSMLVLVDMLSGGMTLSHPTVQEHGPECVRCCKRKHILEALHCNVVVG